MGWIKNLITSRYVKSAVRYLITALIVYINKNNLPYLDPIVQAITQNSEQITELLTVALMGLLGTWTVAKNSRNAKTERVLKRNFPKMRVR